MNDTIYQVAFSDTDGDIWVLYPSTSDYKALVSLAKTKAMQHDQAFTVYQMPREAGDDPIAVYTAQP